MGTVAVQIAELGAPIIRVDLRHYIPVVRR